jgi:hypothetical protein
MQAVGLSSQHSWLAQPVSGGGLLCQVVHSRLAGRPGAEARTAKVTFSGDFPCASSGLGKLPIPGSSSIHQAGKSSEIIAEIFYPWSTGPNAFTTIRASNCFGHDRTASF